MEHKLSLHEMDFLGTLLANLWDEDTMENPCFRTRFKEDGTRILKRFLYHSDPHYLLFWNIFP